MLSSNLIYNDDSFSYEKQTIALEDNINDFLNQIKYAYDKYEVVATEDSNNLNYELSVYAGIIDEKVYYSIYFKNTIPNEYNIKLAYNDKLYNLSHDARGDVVLTAVDLSSTDTFSICIFDKNGHFQYGKMKFQDLESKNFTDFLQSKNLNDGQGQGASITKIRNDIQFTRKVIIYTVLVSVLLACGIIIFIYYKRSKGMFRSDIRSANVFNFKEFINSVPEASSYDDEYEELEPVEEFIEEEKVSTDNLNEENLEEETPGKVINKTYLWYHYEEEKSGFNIKGFLKEANLPTNYASASLEDKNKIMLELMRLRDNDKITQDDYLDEISELWKS